VSLANVAAFVVAIALLITASSGAYAQIRSVRKVAETHGMVKQIDAAVNGKPPGATTMVSQVQDMHDRLPPVTNGDAVLPMLRTILAKMEAEAEGKKG